MPDTRIHAPRSRHAAATRNGSSPWLRWRVAVPPEKGGWIWWLGPLAVGVLASPQPGPAQALVAIGALAGYCLRQPLTVLARQSRRKAGAVERQPAVLWTGAYLAVLGAVAVALLQLGLYRVVALGLLGVPVLAWHLYLVRRGEARRQWTLNTLAACALALVAPAAYWAGGGPASGHTLALWALPAAQSAASILHMQTRLVQRTRHALPSVAERLRAGARPGLAHGLATLLALACWMGGVAGSWAVVALLLAAVEGAWSVFHPQTGHSPMRIGLRQLVVSTAAMLLLGVGLATGTRTAP